MPGPVGSELGPIYRHATPRDAPRICMFYEAEYRPPDGGDARDHYPFPQFMEPAWLASAVDRNDICWIVAELDGRVVGSAGAMRNIGTAADRVAEIFGIVVDHHDRGRNIGSGLLDYLCEALRDDVDVILCEARTGDVRGWKVVRHAGFHPIGFEPFAHKTPVGSESMLLTARFRKAANPHPAAVFATDRARDLARAVAQCSLDSQPFYQEPEPRCPLPPCPPHPDGAPFSLIRDDVKGAEILSKWRDRFRHRSGVVDLRRIEGINLPGRPRYDARHYLLCQPDQVLSCAHRVGSHRLPRADPQPAIRMRGRPRPAP